MLDIFSRKVIRWEVHYGESGDLAKAFMQHAIIANGGAKPRYIHADNGTSMTSKNVATLLTDLDITRSHSRPHVSNDNPFSEAAFKTLKYCPVFPGTFATLDDARAFSALLFTYYNNEHRHSGSGSTRQPRSTTVPPGHPGPPPAGPRRRLRRPPRPVPRTTPASPGPARQGVDQQAPHHHRDPGDPSEKSSRLMSQ